MGSAKKIELIRGDSRDVVVRFRDSDGTALSITNGTVFFTVNAESNPSSDTGAAISKDITDHTDAENGVSTISLSAADTTITPGDYYYDIQLKDSDGDITSSYTGELTVVADITRRTS